MNDISSFPRADPGLVPNVPVNDIYQHLVGEIRSRADRDDILRKLLHTPAPSDEWQPGHVEFAACQFLENLIKSGYVPVYFEDERGDFRSVPHPQIHVDPNLAGQAGAGMAHKLLTFTRGIAEFIELPAMGRVIAGRSLFMAPDARMKVDQSFAQHYPQKVEQTVDQEAAKRELVARLNSARRWHLAEVLFWIGFRSVETMAEYLVDAHSPDTSVAYYRLNAANLVLHISLVLSDRAGILSRGLCCVPEKDLIDALSQGHVTAMGLLEGEKVRGFIPAEEWPYLTFGGQGRFGPIIAGHWSNVDFDRVEIIAAFPVPKAVRPEFSDDQIKAELLKLKNKSGNGPMATNPAWKIIQGRMPGVTRDRMISVRDTLGYEKKPGPKGQRNCAG